MITEGEAAILLETTRRAFRNQSQSKQRSTLVNFYLHLKKFLSMLARSWMHFDTYMYIDTCIILVTRGKFIIFNIEGHPTY